MRVLLISIVFTVIQAVLQYFIIKHETVFYKITLGTIEFYISLTSLVCTIMVLVLYIAALIMFEQ